MAARARTMATLDTQYYWLINPGRAGRVYDLAGHSLGGGERIQVTGVDSVGQLAVDRKYLILKPIPQAPPTPEPEPEPTP